jgi:hypothetical protein
VADDRTFGSLVIFGPGDGARELVRLTPLTDTDACKLISGIPGERGALRDLLLRVSRLADDLPEVTEVDLSPVIALPRAVSASAAGARVKVAPREATDPFLRRLR